MKKNLLPCIYLKKGKLVTGFRGNSVISEEPVKYVEETVKNGADSLLVFDLSKGDEEHEQNLTILREITKNLSIPVIGAGNIKRSEDVKKLKYAGCGKVALNMAKQTNIDLIEEVSKRFGKDSIYACVDVEEEILNNAELIRQYVSGVILLDDSISDAYKDLIVTCVVNNGSYDMALKLLENDCVNGISGNYVNQNAEKLMELKQRFKADGLDMNLVTAKFSFEDFKVGSDGLVPVVVQDDATGQVLMVAYMNKEAYEKTIEGGRMTYYSRSRNELWLKGETSGHFQYVRSLYGDCDMD
ncbi:MAG: bifunctional phosphoribosyl-AMP cyclohydrolase/phosphoribosyl-ATP pyrophosphatase, partial [Lachnospiraceae bacterium]|nr:bifunctional phosphoribosyl-AMP cyclohydrolase/phosphoribosyl-ATP pyrophosphatase [Lachnospiraceae bacterium]